ncbi:MAG: hypothetical protein AAGD33_07080 [Actinomycetota bacterium]
MTDRSGGPDPWRPLVGEPTEEDFENAYDGDAELDATIRARRRRRRIAAITAGGALTFAIGGSLVLPEGDADAPSDSPSATLASADRQPSDDDDAGDEDTGAAPVGDDPADREPDGGTTAPLPVATTIDLPPALANAVEPFEIVAVTPSELHRISVPSGAVTTRSLVDDERFRTGSFSIAASPTMAAVRVADDSVALIPNSNAPIIDWPADTFGSPDPRRTTYIEAVAPGEDDRFVIATVTTFDPDPGEDGVIDESEIVFPETERLIVDPGVAAPIDRILTELPDGASPIGATGFWWVADDERPSVSVVSPSGDVQEFSGALVGVGRTSIAVSSCTDECRLDVITYPGPYTREPTTVRTIEGSTVPDAFVGAFRIPGSRFGWISDDATLMTDPIAGVIDLTDGSVTTSDGVGGPSAWVPGTSEVIGVFRAEPGLSVIDPRTGEATTFGAELGRPVAIATVPLD